MIFFNLALKSLRSRLFAVSLTVVSIACSVALLLGIEAMRRGAKEGFTSAVSQVDLIVGPRAGSLQLILFSVFNIGSVTHNMSWESYEKLKTHPLIDWTIPYSLGDGHKGFRVVATDNSFFEHYRFHTDQKVRFKAGQPFETRHDVVVIGAQVAKKLNYKLGEKIIVSHGSTTGESFLEHSENPFEVIGILESTGTPIDQSVYITLESMDTIHDTELKDRTITSVFLRAKSRIETLKLQREINQNPDEALMAIIPGSTLQELWRSMSYIETALRSISIFVLVVSFITLVISLMTSLNERRREMAIFRSLGLGLRKIFGLLMFESVALSLLGLSLGLLIHLFIFSALKNWIESSYAIYLSNSVLRSSDFIYMIVVLGFGVAVGVIPAWRAYRQSLRDGLSASS